MTMSVKKFEKNVFPKESSLFPSEITFSPWETIMFPRRRNLSYLRE